MPLLNKTQQLEAIRQAIIDNQVCLDLALNAKQLVFGSGNIDARVVLIGEAPGKSEDETGVPFVGAAGKMLDQLLASINLDRQEVYITNIVKYRPANNRDPSESEKNAFLPYLISQLEVINPKVLITLGKHAASCFDHELVISKDHGKLRHLNLHPTNNSLLNELKWLPLYHPAAALYNGSLRQTLFNDFLRVAEVIDINKHNKANATNEQLIMKLN